MKSLFRLIFFVFCFTFFFIQCDKNEDDKTSDCIKLFDVNGQPIGTYGDCAGNQDWEAQSLSNSERKFLDFEDGLPEVNASDNLNFERFHAYPNPVPKGFPFGITFEQADEEFKVKIAIIDTDNNLLFQQGFLGSTQNIQLQLPENFTEMSKYFKILYHYYTDNHGVLFEGSGQILVCDAPNITNIEEDCF